MLESPLNPGEKRQFYVALYALSMRDGSFDIFRQHLKSESRRLEKNIRTLKDDTELRWTQCALQVLGDLESMFTNARAILEKLET